MRSWCPKTLVDDDSTGAQGAAGAFLTVGIRPTKLAQLQGAACHARNPGLWPREKSQPPGFFSGPARGRFGSGGVVHDEPSLRQRPAGGAKSGGIGPSVPMAGGSSPCQTLLRRVAPGVAQAAAERARPGYAGGRDRCQTSRAAVLVTHVSPPRWPPRAGRRCGRRPYGSRAPGPLWSECPAASTRPRFPAASGRPCASPACG